MGRPKNSKNGQPIQFKKTCLTCGSEFFVVPKRRDIAKYCSNECRIIAMPSFARKPSERICPTCSKTFITTRKSTKTYCSHACAMKDHGRKISGSNNGNFIEKIGRECPICHKTFKVSPNDTRRVHCSKKCHNISFTVPLVRFQCPICGSEKMLTPFIAHKKKFCSRKCAVEGAGKSNTSIEISIANELSKRNIQHVSQYPIAYYTLDFAIPERKIAIECDGDYWHSLPDSSRRDKAKDSFLTNRGWKIIRLKESDIRSSPASCIDSILQILNSE